MFIPAVPAAANVSKTGPNRPKVKKTSCCSSKIFKTISWGLLGFTLCTILSWPATLHRKPLYLCKFPAAGQATRTKNRVPECFSCMCSKRQSAAAFSSASETDPWTDEAFRVAAVALSAGRPISAAIMRSFPQLGAKRPRMGRPRWGANGGGTWLGRWRRVRGRARGWAGCPFGDKSCPDDEEWEDGFVVEDPKIDCGGNSENHRIRPLQVNFLAVKVTGGLDFPSLYWLLPDVPFPHVTGQGVYIAVVCSGVWRRWDLLGSFTALRPGCPVRAEKLGSDPLKGHVVVSKTFRSGVAFLEFVST